MDPIASKWQGLASMDQHSPDFIPLLSSLIARAGHLSTMKLRDGSAKIALDALDKVDYPFFTSGKRLSGDGYCVFRQIFRDGRIPDDYERDTRDVMRKLAHNSGQVPPRYQVKPGTLSVEGSVITGGAFSDIRRGKLGEKTVAVKTLRTCRESNPQDAQKVRLVPRYFCGVH